MATLRNAPSNTPSGVRCSEKLETLTSGPLAAIACAFPTEFSFRAPSATYVPLTDSTRTVRLWTFNEASLARILSFMDTGLFHISAGPDGRLEDLTIYRRGELVLGLASHEQAGVLCLAHQEHADVAALEIPWEATADWIRY